MKTLTNTEVNCNPNTNFMISTQQADQEGAHDC